MRHVAAVVLVLGVLAFAGARRSQADMTSVNGYCFSTPYNTLVSCDAGTPAPTAVPVTPVKELNVGGPVAGPDGTTSFDVGITTQLSCFSLNEPTELYALANPGSAIFTELFPTPGPSGQALNVTVEQNGRVAGSGTAALTLEVNNAAVGPGGLDVKAVWPNEQVERVVNVIPPVPTDTPGPGTPTNTPTPEPTATDTPTPTSTPSGTPSPSPAATAAPFTLRACVQPSILSGHSLGGDVATVNGLTTPGAVCTSAVRYLDGTTPTGYNGSAQTANGSGLVSYSLAEDTMAGGGIAGITCTLNGVSRTTCAGFLVLQSTDGALTDADQQGLLSQIQALAADPATCSTIA